MNPHFTNNTFQQNSHLNPPKPDFLDLDLSLNDESFTHPNFIPGNPSTKTIQKNSFNDDTQQSTIFQQPQNFAPQLSNNIDTHQNQSPFIPRFTNISFTNMPPLPQTEKLIPNSHEYRTNSWTQEEDDRLLKAIDLFGFNWQKISEYVGNKRTRSQCSQRWSRVLDPSISREPWSEEEEALLLHLVQMYGSKSWKKLSEHMPNRNDSQCRFHYLHMQKENENIQRILVKQSKGRSKFIIDDSAPNVNQKRDNPTSDSGSSSDSDFQQPLDAYKEKTAPKEISKKNESNDGFNISSTTMDKLVWWT